MREKVRLTVVPDEGVAGALLRSPPSEGIDCYFRCLFGAKGARLGTIGWVLPRIVIDHCVIAVSDWERSNAFYRDVLGAEVDQKDDWFGHYRFGDWQLNVHGPGFAGLNAEKPVEPGNSDLCFVWPGAIEEAVEHLGRHGVAIVAGPLEGDSGAGGRARHVYFRDPDGSLLEFVSYRWLERSRGGI